MDCLIIILMLKPYMERQINMEFESNEQILQDLMDQLHTLHKENARLLQKIEALEKHNEELNRKLKSIQALFL